MDTFKSFAPNIYNLNGQEFDDIALRLFQFQARTNTLYQQYIHHLGVNPAAVKAVLDIPFLPIAFFKSHSIKSGNWAAEAVFTSSGTTQNNRSRHEIADLSYYLVNAERTFEYFFGPLKNYHFFALLPSYLERTGSSLIAMIEDFITKSESQYSGFYLYEIEKLLRDIEAVKSGPKKTILWGVSFALLDLAESMEIDLSHCIIMETGGMKGRRKEITRQELHNVLKSRLNATQVYSEYGMTELLSQAYTGGGYSFKCPPWMRVIGRDLLDPLSKGLLRENAGLNVIDLANSASIAFIETEDMGKVFDEVTFEVLGRIDNTDIRGCNLLL